MLKRIERGLEIKNGNLYNMWSEWSHCKDDNTVKPPRSENLVSHECSIVAIKLSCSAYSSSPRFLSSRLKELVGKVKADVEYTEPCTAAS